MISNGFSTPNDRAGQWALHVYVTDLNISRDFGVRGETHVGGLMLKIAQDIDVTKDWSDHALWWPARNRWLTHTRSTLDQYRVPPESILEFTPMHKAARVQLPDLQIIAARLNFSVPTFNAAVEFCKEIGIRHQEELSFKRYIPPEVLAKGLETREYQTNTFMISPGLDPYTPAGAPNAATNGTGDLVTLPRNAPIVGQMARSQILPSTVSYGSSLYRAGSVPAIQAIDAVRINQIYEQAKWGVLTEEFECNESEAYSFAGLQLHVEQKTENKQNGVSEPEVDDVDIMLTELENLLEGNFMAKRASEFSSTDPELADYLLFSLPRKSGLLSWRRAFFVLHGLSVHWYNSSHDSRGPPMGRIYLRSAEVSNDSSVAESRYMIKLLVPSPQNDANEVLLKFDSEQRYVKWLAACRLASRGKTMADGTYANEVTEVQSTLAGQQRLHGRGVQPLDQNVRSLQLSNSRNQNFRDLNPDDYLPLRFSRASGLSAQQKINDAQSNVGHLNLVDTKLQYVKMWQGLREHTLHYFVVRYRDSKQPELLIITTNRMIRCGLNGEQPFTIWPFANMKKWHVNWEIRHIFIQMENEDVEFTCLSADCKVPHEFIGGYIFMSTRSRDKNQALNSQLFHKLTGGWSANEVQPI